MGGVSGSGSFEFQTILNVCTVESDGWGVALLTLALGFESK